MDTAAKNIARWVALGALFLLPLAPLIVANSFYFPFITGKGFYVRILIEVAVAGWIVLALLDRQYRPRFSWIGAAAVLFVVWMGIANAFALNPAKAYWSNFERMEGWIWLIHLLGFFFAASNVLRVEKKWRVWFFTSVGVAFVVSLYALLQLFGVFEIHQGSTRIDATFGNSIYLAVYLLFTTFIAGWLAHTESRPWLKWSLLIFAAFEAALIFFTGTRGTIVGLALALTLAALLTAFTAGRHARRYALAALALIIILAGSFYLARDTSFVQENYVLQRVASISWADLEVRRTIWHMALQGTLERPLVGWGQEGFNYVFNTYYNPSLFRQEPWFDRAHNAFLDWLTAGGIPAFLLYLALFTTAIIALWRHSELSRPERIAITAAFAGYAVHNLFVFDNLYSSIYFFALLALIDSQVSRPIKKLDQAGELGAETATIYALPITVVLLAMVVWWVNVTGMRVASGLIHALSPTEKGIGENISLFTKLAARPAFAAQEVREQLISFASQVVQSSAATEEKQKAVTLAITEMQKQVAQYPADARARIQLSHGYRAAGDLAGALTEAEAALELSPKRQLFWIDVGMLAWEGGDAARARESFRQAYELSPQFSELAVYAAAGEIAVGNTQRATEIITTAQIDWIHSDVLAVAYARTKDWKSLIEMMVHRTKEPGAGVQAWFSLASAYYLAGDRAAAVRAITTAVEKFPEYAALGAAAIAEIEAGK